jgi:hypothetical protein
MQNAELRLGVLVLFSAPPYRKYNDLVVLLVRTLRPIPRCTRTLLERLRGALSCP